MSKFQLLDKDNSALIFIDHQPQMAFGVANIDRQQLKNNVVGLAKAGKIFNVPTLFTSVETESFSGYIWPELLAVHPEITPIERTSMNSWEDAAFVKAVEATGRKKLVISALWTEVCLTFPALMALEAGYEVYVVTDTSGGTSVDAHERSIDRMVQAGAIPVTWQQVLLEYQRDWARKETYDAVMALVREHSGAYG
ncbi:MAG: hydrolase, partial [Serratia proteamaculans]